MKAVTIKSPGGLGNLQLVERSRPTAGRGEVVIQVFANSLNFHDYVVAVGLMPVPDGRIGLSDGAGKVVEVGDGVERLGVGDDVMSVFYPRWLSGEAEAHSTSVIPGETVDGYAAEYVVVPESWVTPMPKGYSYAEAATLPCAGVTAWKAVIERPKLKPGDYVLIQGTGGVSIFALQFAKAVGATVIATSSSEQKLARLRELGADHVIDYRENPSWGSAAMKLTGGRGVDLVVEIGGPGTLDQSITACRIGGYISLIGVLTGISGEVATYRIFTKQITIQGIAVGSREDQLAMVRGLEGMGIRPVIDSVYPLQELKAAFTHQEQQRHFGKICIKTQR